LRGREEALQQPSVAIVGSRNASAAGLAFADRLARGLGQAGYVVVSGLARGIDQRAHVAALETGTVAVLAGGHSKPYPPEAAPLLPRIAENGAIVSEAPLAWEPRGRDFPRRNRIVSGLALGVIIVEAARGSGSLITARLAAEQGREVLAAPGSPLDPRAEGTNDLLRDGATLCARVEDALAALEPLRARASLGRMEEPRPSDDLWLDEPAEAEEPASAERVEIGEMSVGARIAALLGPAPVSIDDLARAAGADVRSVRAALIELELAGRIEHSGGDRVALLTGRERD
jgi:DNA processing protein